MRDISLTNIYLVNGENIDSLILLENNSPKYGTSYMCVGKEIVLNKTINNKTEVNKTNNDLTIWYMITIVGIIGLSIIYLKNTY